MLIQIFFSFVCNHHIEEGIRKCLEDGDIYTEEEINILKFYLEENGTEFVIDEKSKSLEIKIYSNNSLESKVPEEICILKKLDKLIIKTPSNPLILPANFKNLCNLKEIEIEASNVENMEENIFYLFNLRNLTLYVEKKLAINENIRNLRNLERLTLKSHEEIVIGNGFFELENLKYLKIMTSRLTYLNYSENIFNLKNLEIADIDINFLEVDSFNLIFPGIRLLNDGAKNLNCSDGLNITSGNSYNTNTDKIMPKLKKLKFTYHGSEEILEFVRHSFPLCEHIILKIKPDKLIITENSLLKNLKILEIYSDSGGKLDITKMCLPSLEMLCIKNTTFMNEYDNILHSNIEVIGDFTYYKKLKLLEINSCDIKCLSGGFQGLENLEIIKISGIGNTDSDHILSKIRNYIKSNNTIKKLTMTNCNLKILPEEIYNLTNLEYLDISLNRIKKIKSKILNLNKLEILNIHGNDINKLPKEFHSLTNLKDLDISWNYIKDISFKISSLKKLEVLKVSYCGLDKLPEEIYNLTNLKYLDISLNVIKEIKPKILSLDKLEILNASCNEIDKIPENIFYLENLKELSLSGNIIKFLPSEFLLNKKLKMDIDFDYLSFYYHNRKGLGLFDLPIDMIKFYNNQNIKSNDNKSIKWHYKKANKGDIKWNLNEVFKKNPYSVKHRKKDFDELKEIWFEYIERHINEYDLKNNFWNYIKSLYDEPHEKNQYIISDEYYIEGIESIKEYVSGIFDILKKKIDNKETQEIETYIGSLLYGVNGVCIDGQLEVFKSIYNDLKFGYDKYTEIKRFIYDNLSILKEYYLEKVASRSQDSDSVYIFNKWRRKLKDKLGLEDYETFYSMDIEIPLFRSRAYILYQFFKIFTPENIIQDMVDIINYKNKSLIGEVFLFFRDH